MAAAGILGAQWTDEFLFRGTGFTFLTLTTQKHLHPAPEGEQTGKRRGKQGKNKGKRRCKEKELKGGGEKKRRGERN